MDARFDAAVGDGCRAIPQGVEFFRKEHAYDLCQYAHPAGVTARIGGTAIDRVDKKPDATVDEIGTAFMPKDFVVFDDHAGIAKDVGQKIEAVRKIAGYKSGAYRLGQQIEGGALLVSDGGFFVRREIFLRCDDRFQLGPGSVVGFAERRGE